MNARRSRSAWAAITGLGLGLLVPGCGRSSAPVRQVTFAAARQAPAVVAVAGAPDLATVRRQTGQPTEFTLREPGSGSRIQVVAPAAVTVPANLPSATYVVVTGTYQPATGRFVATQVETQVPPRELQPRG